jgi:hypothetical protein
MKQPRITFEVDLGPELEEQTRARAKQLGLTLDEYLEKLLLRDYFRAALDQQRPDDN